MKTTRRNLFALAAGAVAAPVELLKATTSQKMYWEVNFGPDFVFPPPDGFESDFSTDAWRRRLVMRWEESFREWRGTHGS